LWIRINVLLRLVRADREANFQLHQDSVMETVQYFILTGRVTTHISGEYADSFKSRCLTTPNSKLNVELRQSHRTRDKEGVAWI